jgi:hypothetical protein
MAIPIPADVRGLLDAPNYVHLSTLRADGSPRNWVVWVGLEDDHILVCTSDAIWKAKDMRRDPRVAMSVTDMANPYRMAAIQRRGDQVIPAAVPAGSALPGDITPGPDPDLGAVHRPGRHSKTER